MKLPIKERAFTTGMVILATIVVIVLAALQYRWSNQVSEATSIRLADSLQMSMINWHLDFFRDFSEICMAMRVDPEVASKSDGNQYVNRFAEWKKTTAHPELVSDIYLLNSPTSRLTPARCASIRRNGVLNPLCHRTISRSCGRNFALRLPVQASPAEPAPRMVRIS